VSVVERIACEWMAAERERKLRKHESKIAWMLAFKSGVKFEPRGDGYYQDVKMVAVSETDEQHKALARAENARKTYLLSARKAGALRAALSRKVPARPERNREIWQEFDALCAREAIAYEAQP
jgi:hypothetical protein